MDYTIADLRVDIAEIKAKLDAGEKRYEDALAHIEQSHEDYRNCITKVSKEVSDIKNDISRWKGAIGVAMFIITAMSSVLTTAINKLLFSGT